MPKRKLSKADDDDENDDERSSVSPPRRSSPAEPPHLIKIELVHDENFTKWLEKWLNILRKEDFVTFISDSVACRLHDEDFTACD